MKKMSKNKRTVIISVCFLVALIIGALVLFISYYGTDIKPKDIIKIVTLNPIDTETSKSITPALGYDLSVAQEKGIANKSFNEESYLKLESAYVTVFDYYINIQADIDKYQSVFDNSVLDFEPTMKKYETKDAEHICTYFDNDALSRANISVRNIAYIERLSKKDLKILKYHIDGNELYITNKLLSIIERTWKEIIVVSDSGTDNNFESHNIIYDPYVMFGLNVKNDAIVFLLTYDRVYNKAGEIDENLESGKYETVFALKEKMEKEVSEIMGTDVSVLIKVGE